MMPPSEVPEDGGFASDPAKPSTRSGHPGDAAQPIDAARPRPFDAARPADATRPANATRPVDDDDADAGRRFNLLPNYAELDCLSNFSFLKGASHPEELVMRAHELGYAALAITDECSLAGVVRAHAEAKVNDLKLIVGSSFVLDDGLELVVLATNLNGYGNLSELITLARMRSDKGTYRVSRADFDGSPQPAASIPPSAGAIDHLAGLADCLVLWRPPREAAAARLEADARWLATTFPDRAWIAVERAHRMDDELVRERHLALGRAVGLPCVATGHVHMHVRSRKPLQDTLTAIRLKKTVAECGDALVPNAERYLRSRMRLSGLFPAALLRETVAIADRCVFSLKELGYRYPQEIVPKGQTQTSQLRRLTEEGLLTRYPRGTPDKVRHQVEHELALIAELEYEPFFLTVHDIVRYARSRKILCQGRGSAANSAVCYCLGITEVDPALQNMLFERFITKERNEPPDIDVDFEHQRREEVIQYVYDKYGRHRTALAAAVIAYRTRSSVKDVGKALGIDPERVQQLSSSHAWWDGSEGQRDRLEENGFDPDSPVIRKLVELTATLRSFPRHLSQHVGGFVISADKLSRMVPIENAAMVDRSVIQWDKDDLEELGLLKVDVLALGMLTAIRRSLDLVARRRGLASFSMDDVPKEDAAVYDMICKADTIGVFQIESRAQMSMLPRLKPRTYYDLVVEVAIVRPGPIQGGMVHPYLKARDAVDRGEPIHYPKPAVKEALERTLGVPIFQEQVMQLMMLAADFTAGEADQLRRAMAAWKRKGGLGPFERRIVGGLVERGYEREYAERIFRQVEGFGEYGFPESHAASFAFLVYISSWLKHHEPAAFLAALLNSQPMGFYSPSQLIQDAKRHGIEVRPIDVTVSAWDATLEEDEASRADAVVDAAGAGSGSSAALPMTDDALADAGMFPRATRFASLEAPTEPAVSAASRAAEPKREAPSRIPPSSATTDRGKSKIRKQPAVRLGFNSVRGFGEDAAGRVLEARARSTFRDVEDLARRADLSTAEVDALAAADALSALAGHRRQARWQSAGHRIERDLMREARIEEVQPELPLASEASEIVADYASTGFTLRRHPLALLRPRLSRMRLSSAAELSKIPNGRFVRTTGLVTVRQRPGTAKGTIFVTLEDETGTINVIAWPQVVESQRRPLLSARLLTVHGVWQRQNEVCHVLGNRFIDHSAWIGSLHSDSRNFH